MTTTTASASWNIRLVREMLKTVKPNDLTDDEIVAMVEILRAAADRKQELSPAWCTSIWCDPASARGVKGTTSVPSARYQPPGGGPTPLHALASPRARAGCCNCGARYCGTHRPAVTARRSVVAGDGPTYIHERRRPAVRLQQ
jgi:hypothetical protein